jgi:hypothetical protein
MTWSCVRHLSSSAVTCPNYKLSLYSVAADTRLLTLVATPALNVRIAAVKRVH